MRATSRTPVVLAISIGVVVAIGLALWSVSSRPGPRFADPPNGLTLASLHGFAGYPVYGVGRQIDGLALSFIFLQPPESEVGSGFVAMRYGTCQLGSGSPPTCSYPLEIESWRACTRDEGTSHPPSVTTKRGARVGHFGGGRLEVYTGLSTVVISTASQELRQDVLDALGAQNPLAARAMRGGELAPPTTIPRSCS
jgi:hypothetical protein